MTNLRVNPALPADSSAIEALERAVFGGESYPRFFLRQAMALWPDWVLVARAGTEPAPLGYGLGAASAAPGEAWILSLATAPSARGRGVGRELLGALLAALAAAGIRDVRLTVHPDNGAARRLYERAGFTMVARVPDYFGPDEPRLVLHRSLAAAAPFPASPGRA